MDAVVLVPVCKKTYTDQPKYYITLTCEVNNIDYLVLMAPVSGWDILGSM